MTIIFEWIKRVVNRAIPLEPKGQVSGTASIKSLASFKPFNEQSEAIQILITGSTEIKTYRFGHSLFREAEDDDIDYILVNGSLSLRARDGKETSIDHESEMASMPLAMLRPRQFSARVSSREATFYQVPHSALAMINEDMRSARTEVPILEVTIGDIPKNTILDRAQKDILLGRLSLVSLPEVALMVKEACEDKESSLDDIANIINRDPAMAVKVSGAANSVLYRGVEEVKTIKEAVCRLGRKTTQYLVFYFSTKELFVSKEKILEKVFRRSWKDALDRAVMAQTIAKLSTQKFDPDTAFLCGLLFRVGDLLILQYMAKNINEIDELEKIKNISEQESAGISYLAIKKWRLSKTVAKVLKSGVDWSYCSDVEEGDYIDLMVATNVLLRVKNKEIAGLPDFNKIPALNKIMNKGFAKNTSVMLEYRQAISAFSNM